MAARPATPGDESPPVGAALAATRSGEACEVASRLKPLPPGPAATFTVKPRPIRDQVRRDNLLQVRTAAAATRISHELVSRLELLDRGELQALVAGSLTARGYLLWAATCRRYEFIRDFAIEVVREHYLLLRHQLTLGDYVAFCNAKALCHPELDVIAPATAQRLRQDLFRMLREANLLTAGWQIQPALLSPDLARLLGQHGREALLIFPATDNEIQRWLQ